MVEVCPRSLWAAAATVYDETPRLQDEARRAAGSGFRGGARWMALALSELRQTPGGRPAPGWLGIMKYGLASACAIGWGLGTWSAGWAGVIGALLVFYAVEAQMVFLFPLAVDEGPTALWRSRAWTVRAGGTLRVMSIVLPIAAGMIFGGLFGRGSLRSWCIGCLAVCLWYEHVRTSC